MRGETSQTVILPMTPHPAGEMPYKKRQGLGKSVSIRGEGQCERQRQGWASVSGSGVSVRVGLAVIRFEVPEIDSSGLVGLAAIVFEVPEVDSSGLIWSAWQCSSRLSSRPPGV